MIQEQPEVSSFYVPYLSFDKEASHLITTKYIEPIVNKFFGVRKVKEIDSTKYISDLDFEKVEFSYFYDNILAGIKKDESGKINHEVKYCITFDEEVTSKTCERTKIKYDEILLNEKPIFYFIYVDLKEMMSFLRIQDRQKLEQM